MDPIGQFMRLGYLFVSMLGLGDSAPVSQCPQGAIARPVAQIASMPAKKSLQWDWSKIDTSAVAFPQGFLFGVGTSAYQVEGGCTNNQYSPLEATARDAKGNLCLPEFSGAACDHWNRYKDDIQLLKALGANAFRLSVEWSKVQPREDYFDPVALQHYVDVCDELNKNGIKPAITIHHYTDPLWFANKGGFEKEENLHYYADYAAKLFEVLGDRVHLWFTFNSPVGYAMPGYYSGGRPPYKKDMQLAVEVLKNMCEAHVQAYFKIKALPGGESARVGILHNVNQMDPISSFDPISKIVQVMGDKISNTCVFDFFTTGVFKVKVPFKVNVKHVNPQAPHALDFIGLNYYSHTGLKLGRRMNYPGEMPVCKKEHTIYAEGLYRALKLVSDEVASKLQIPIYVTENGIAPLSNDEDRDLFLRRYLYALSQAIRDGIDVRGYFYWSLMDNYEWGSYTDRYGLYHVDFATQKRTLKPSARYFVEVAHRWAA